MIQDDFERQLFQMSKADLDNLQDPYIQTAQTTDRDQERLQDISEEELDRILAAHVKCLESDGKAGQKANLSRVNLRGANLPRVNLQGANLAGSDLLWINSFGAEFQGADLSGANLREAYLEEANLQGAILEGANLQEAFLVGANLQGADLTRANLRQANLRLADLKNANLVEANLQDTHLKNAKILNANLKGAIGLSITQLSTAKDLSQAKLDPELSEQILNFLQSLENPPIPKASVPTGAAEKKPLKRRKHNKTNSRRQPRKTFSKLVFIASQNQYCKGLIKNINSFGAYIETNTEFYRRQMVKLEIPGTQIDNGTLIICEVARTDLSGIGIKFKKLIQRNRFSQDMGGMRSGTDRRKLLFSEYYPEKRSDADRRGGVDRRKLKYFKYYKYGLQLNRIIDNGGRRFIRDRRRRSFGLYWPENRKIRDRRSIKDRRIAFTTKAKKAVVTPDPQKRLLG